MTTMAAAFAKSGALPRDAALWRAIAQFQNNGGTYEIALAMLERAYRKGTGGSDTHASEARLGLPPVPNPNDGEEANVSASPVDHSSRAPSPSREGHIAGADQAKTSVPSRIPNAPRGLTAIAAVQPTMAKSLFDTILLPDGRRLRHVRWSECPTLARKYRTVAHILTAVHDYAIPPDPNASLDSIVTEKDLATIVSNAEKSNA